MVRKLLCLAVLTLMAPSAWAIVITAENTPHVIFNTIPFGMESGSGRYQQVYASSLFSGPVFLNTLAFSPDTTGTYEADVTIRLTTTAAAVGALSATLDDNLGAPLTTVFDDPAFSQAVTGGSETFSLLFDFSASPFLYDPGAGNLLLDILISDKSYGGAFSRSGAGAVFSRAYDNTTYGANADLVGLRTQIGYDEVPEPASVLLLGAGLLGFAVRRRRSS